MNIVIVGAGRVGQTLAEKLSRDGHDVTLIEESDDKVRELSETLDARVIAGNGATAPELRRAGVEDANLVVAVTNSDEVNMVIGMLASFAFHVPRIVVRLREADHAEGFDLIGQDHPGEHVWVNPDVAAVDRIAALLEVPGAVDVVSFMDGELIVAGFRINAKSDFVGVRVSDLNLLFAATPTLAVAIHRKDDWIIPHGGEEIEGFGGADRPGVAQHPEGPPEAILQLGPVVREHGLSGVLLVADDLLEDPLDILHEFLFRPPERHLVRNLEEVTGGLRALSVEPPGGEAQLRDRMEHFIDLF